MWVRVWWVCHGACGGGGDGRNSTFCRGTEFDDRVPIFSVFKKSLRMIMTLSLLFGVMSV